MVFSPKCLDFFVADEKMNRVCQESQSPGGVTPQPGVALERVRGMGRCRRGVGIGPYFFAFTND